MAALDLVGIIDPTGIADALSASIYASQGDLINSLISGAGLIPYIGDFAKAFRRNNPIKILSLAVESGSAARGTTRGLGTTLRRTGSLLESVDDIFTNPFLLKDKSPLQIEGLLGKMEGWKVEALGKGSHAGQGFILREYRAKGSTGRMIQWHPGGGHHGPNPYWKVSDGTKVTRIFQ